MITIREEKYNPDNDTFDATVCMAGNDYPVTIDLPFSNEEENILEWYFEQWLRYPMLDNVRVDKACEIITNYGHKLFKQVFESNIKCYSKLQNIINSSDEITIAIEAKTPEFNAIHWETIKNPDSSTPFAIDYPFIRKSNRDNFYQAQVNPSPTINLLVVTARPKLDEDAGYRTISLPLIEAIRNARLKVKIDLLRPGTYQALENHLEAKGKGYYHLVHFDVHGALKTYDDYQVGVENNRYLYDARYGRHGEIKPYEGVKAFLALEGNEKGEYDLVEAEEIANLLTGKGIPICILNACQSAKQINQNDIADNRETSLGSRLLDAGMNIVVAMSYSVTVTAAKIMMTKLYQYLFASQDIQQAIRLSRRELYNVKPRKAYFNQEIPLEDWLLPVIYSHGKVDFNLQPFTPQEEDEYYQSLETKYKFKQPTYGFVGRDVDILLIEKALIKHNLLLIQGMGGTGKTTLLNYLGQWWQQTNFAEEIFYFGYDKQAYNRQQIVHVIAQTLYDKYEFGSFQSLSLTTQWRKLSEKLRQEDHVIILDNFESVTGQKLAIQHRLDETSRQEIKEFLQKLVGGKTKVIIGSRIKEDWLQENTFADNRYQLKGLDIQARTDLAQSIANKIGSRYSLKQLQEDEYFARLMKLFAGYPLAMEVVLSNLKQQSPQEIYEQLESADIEAGGEDKTNNIVKCIEYSHSNLSPSAQQLLLLLAPFKGFIALFGLENYIKELGKLKAFADLDLENLSSAITEAINWGLLSPIDEYNPKSLIIQPVLPYFLKTKLKQVDLEIQEALEEGFKNYYLFLASGYNSLLKSKEAQERERGIIFVKWEYENLARGLQICLQRKHRVYTIWICLYQYLELIKNQPEQLQLTKSLHNKLLAEEFRDNYQDWEKDIIPIAGNLANCYLQQQDFENAKAIYENTLSLLTEFTTIEKQQKASYQAGTYNQLGIIEQELREYPQAKQYYQQALDIFIEYHDRHNQARTYHQLGMVEQELREYPQAKQYYQQALDICIKYNDRYNQARTYHQLGMIEQELRKYQQAKQYYQQALDICIKYNAQYNRARIYHQLGNVAFELKEYQQAQKYCQQALDICIKCNDRYNQAKIYHQLGMVKQELREYQQAKQYYQQALNIYIGYNDRYSQASTYHQLGNVAYQLREYEQAKQYYQKALELFIKYNDRYNQASTYNQLGLLMVELEEYDRAKNYYDRALQIFAEFNDEYYLAMTIGNIVDLYQKTRDESIVEEVAQILDVSPEELLPSFEGGAGGG